MFKQKSIPGKSKKFPPLPTVKPRTSPPHPPVSLDQGHKCGPESVREVSSTQRITRISKRRRVELIER